MLTKAEEIELLRLLEIERDEKRKERARTDCEYFIENYVFIEDRDLKEIAIPFTLWEGQKRALNAFQHERLNIVLKARQLGLTWLTLAYAVWCMIYNPGYMVVALSKKDDDAKELVRRVAFMLRYMPDKLTVIPTTSQITIRHGTGEDSVFKSFTAAPDSGRSFTANLVILDEWAFQQWARDIWTAAYPTINRPTGGKLIGLSTIERGSLFEDIWIASKNKQNTFNRIFLGWNTDPRRTEEWYEQTRKDLGDSTLAEYPETEQEAFLIPGGSYFTEFKASIHIRQPEFPQDNSVYYIALDYGRDMLAAGLFEINRYGYARMKAEVCKSDLLVSDAATELRKLAGEKKVYAYLAPRDMWNLSNQTGKSNAEVFRDNGIFLTQVVPGSREQGAYMLAEHLRPITLKDEQTDEEYRTALLTFDQGACNETVKCLQTIQKEKNKPNEYANQPHILTHPVDMLCYFIAGRPRPANIPTKPERLEWKFQQKEAESDLAIW